MDRKSKSSASRSHSRKSRSPSRASKSRASVRSSATRSRRDEANGVANGVVVTMSGQQNVRKSVSDFSSEHDSYGDLNDEQQQGGLRYVGGKNYLNYLNDDINSEESEEERHDAVRAMRAPRSPGSLTGPRVIAGHYTLGRKLGKGTVGTVRLARDVDGKEWAIKIFGTYRLEDTGMGRALVLREIAVLKTLQHPYLIGLHDVFRSDHHYYLVMDLAKNGDLFSRVEKADRLSEPVARRYFQQLIMGVKYMHNFNFANRDLSLENILLDENDTVRISNFMWTNVQRKHPLRTICGSPHYIAPEVVIDGNGYNGFALDVWSCGVILFVMLSGRRPFDGETMTELVENIKSGEYVPIRHISPAASDLIKAMLTVNPEERIRLNGIIAHRWFQVGFNREAHPKGWNEV